MQFIIVIRGPAASGGPTVLANDRNGGRLRLNASRHDDDDDSQTDRSQIDNKLHSGKNT